MITAEYLKKLKELCDRSEEEEITLAELESLVDAVPLLIDALEKCKDWAEFSNDSYILKEVFGEETE